MRIDIAHQRFGRGGGPFAIRAGTNADGVTVGGDINGGLNRPFGRRPTQSVPRVIRAIAIHVIDSRLHCEAAEKKSSPDKTPLHKEPP